MTGRSRAGSRVGIHRAGSGAFEPRSGGIARQRETRRSESKEPLVTSPAATSSRSASRSLREGSVLAASRSSKNDAPLDLSRLVTAVASGERSGVVSGDNQARPVPRLRTRTDLILPFGASDGGSTIQTSSPELARRVITSVIPIAPRARTASRVHHSLD